MKKNRKKNLKMRGWVKVNAIITTFLLMFYVTVGTFGGIDIIRNDLSQKYSWATDIGVAVNGLPGEPTLSASTTCESGVSTVNLTWIGSEGATSYALRRNGELLVSGFQDMFYVDSNVIGGMEYTYVMMASGATGDSFSDELVVNANDCGTSSLPIPVVNLTSIDGTQVSKGVSASTPNNIFKITGTNNISNATIKITIKKTTSAEPVIISTLQANSNGYWEYYLPTELLAGSYILQIETVDPMDSSRTAIGSYSFNVTSTVQRSISSGTSSKSGSSKTASKAAIIVNSIGNVVSTPVVTTSPVSSGGSSAIAEPMVQNIGNIEIDLKNKDDKVYRGQDAQMAMVFVDNGTLFGGSGNDLFDLKFEIFNEKNVAVFSNTSSERIFGNQLEKAVHVPEDLPNGKYTIRVSLASGSSILSGESKFVFDDMPVLNFGGGIMVSYPQITSQIGWVAITSATSTLFFGFIFLIEYYFFREAIFTVDEYNLSRRGMIPRRKGVSS